MRAVRNITILSIALIGLLFGNVNAQDLQGRPEETAIAQQAYKRILRLPYYEVYDHIGFEVNGDTVVLTGKVRNAVNKSGAENAVERIPGVTNVVNNIEILPPSRFDDQIRRSLYRSISRTGGLSGYLWPVNPSVRLIVDNGHITLEGYVRNRGDYNLMYISARGVPNSFSVTNNLKIEKDLPN